MSKSVRRWVAVSFVLSLCSSALGGEPGRDPGRTIPRITVLVYNYAQVPDQELADAQQEAGRIVRHTGVKTKWRDYPVELLGVEPKGVVRQGLDPTVIALRIVPHSMAERYGFDSLRFGFALPAAEGQFGNVASIFYHAAERLANFRFRGKETLGQILRRRLPARSMILGHLMAHEMGHLLLGQNSHSAKGIMHVPWGRLSVARAASGKLLFTSKEAKRIRALVQARIRRAPSAQ